MQLPDLSQNTRLTTIWIYGLCDFRSTLREQWIHETISQLECGVPSLEELIINLSMTYVSSLEILDWHTIDTHLSRLAQSHPNMSLTFTTIAPESADERKVWPLWSDLTIVKTLRESLPQVEQRLGRKVKIVFQCRVRPDTALLPLQTFLWREQCLFDA